MKTERVRYLTVRFICQENISEKDAWFILANEVKRLFGVSGAAKAGLYLSYFDPETQGGIFRMSHQAIHLIRASICFLNSYHSQSVFVYSENLTGSLKKAKEHLCEENNQKRFKNLKKSITMS